KNELLITNFPFAEAEPIAAPSPVAQLPALSERETPPADCPYTDKKIMDALHEVLGVAGLDPASPAVRAPTTTLTSLRCAKRSRTFRYRGRRIPRFPPAMTWGLNEARVAT